MTAVDLPSHLCSEVENLVGQVHQGIPHPLHFVRLDGGANNQVFRVESGDSHYCLKWYFEHAGDSRNRLAHEYSFSQYAWSQGIRMIPQPLVASQTQQLALYQYLEGHTLTPSELSPTHVDQALQFLHELNENRKSPSAIRLPVASEASFLWQEHLATVDKRVNRLHDLPIESDLHAKAAEFIQQRLLPRWQLLKSDLERRLLNEEQELGLMNDRLPMIISPSDFGFHNSIQIPDGKLYFIDFEYAGWDSFVKLICDFFHQPQVPVPLNYLDRFVKELATFLPDGAFLGELVRRFLPVYGIKWCCILLNVFLPVHESRRRFSYGKPLPPERLQSQLSKAVYKLESL